MEILMVVFGVLLTYLVYFAYNVLWVLPKRGTLCFRIHWLSDVWQITKVYPVVFPVVYHEENHPEPDWDDGGGLLVSELVKDLVNRQDYEHISWLVSELERNK